MSLLRTCLHVSVSTKSRRHPMQFNERENSCRRRFLILVWSRLSILFL
jgi:hypothetical protein